MTYIRNRRAAALALVLALLGTASIATGLWVEPSSPPVSAATETASAWTGIPASPAPPRAAAAGSHAATAKPALPRTAAAKPATPRTPAATGLPRSEPVRLDIPAIKLKSGLSRLGINRDGTIEVPPLRAGAPAGWYRHSPTPGEPGAAILIGHVDSARDGPAVFFRLRELKAGDTIDVRRNDRSVARFVVTRVASYPKNDFPTEDVYGPTEHPALRLVTCGGSFDRRAGSYRSNVVVYAEAI
ncbi:class F sortase [Actinoplanes sp. NPDC051861]|uniref:class F sortase n=1 Tax=Actinoplanes sp. NPDC051861 TaxID=3155170 RepID=UPI003440DEFF